MADIWTVIIAGVIGVVGPLLTLVIQGRQTWEREQKAHERSQKDTKREQIRSEYAALLEAALTYYNMMRSFHAFAKLADGRQVITPTPQDMQEDTRRRSVLLRDTLNKLDKATVALLLLEPGVEVISEELRTAMEDYTLLVEYPFAAMSDITEKVQQRFDESIDTIIQEVEKLRQTLPERIAKL